MANKSFSTNLGLSLTPEIDQVKDPLIYAELLRLRNALGVLQAALDSYTGALGETDSAYWSQTSPTAYTRTQNISRQYVKAAENMSRGQMVNLFNDAGNLGARKANATGSTLPAMAYCNKDVVTGDYGEFILLGAVPSSGLTPGTIYYLSTSSGLLTSTAPSTVGNLLQQVGYALSSTILYFNPVLNPTVV